MILYRIFLELVAEAIAKVVELLWDIVELARPTIFLIDVYSKEFPSIRTQNC
jgi:hypothetical protein